ncbi:hypothetical protein BGE01nite_23780 [Brevifollis gellanilyticus]|uniref:Uncharacterized protein n=1 Tax=Brevifollis gellanilyticus TaxID=748831 RepID=A0A512M8N4_9BACT|nr:hypothetical protein BGE01nite_23780 [Brevifollis gellanilyticus]
MHQGSAMQNHELKSLLANSQLSIAHINDLTQHTRSLLDEVRRKQEILDKSDVEIRKRYERVKAEPQRIY